MCVCRDAVKRAQAQLDTFQQGAPPYPNTLFRGKGIVIMAGGLTYFVPTWINIHMLRKTGTCCARQVHLKFSTAWYALCAIPTACAGAWIGSIIADTCAK